MMQDRAVLTVLLVLLLVLTAMLFVGWDENAPQKHGVPGAVPVALKVPRNPWQRPGQEKVSVVVAARALPPYTVITEKMVRVRLMNRSEAPPGAFRSIEELKGRSLRLSVSPGQAILTSTVSGLGYYSTDYEIPRGYRVMTISIEGPAAHLDAIRPQDRVDVHLTQQVPDSAGDEQTKTEKILSEIEVYDVHPSQAVESKGISLLVQPKQASIIISSQQKGDITVVRTKK